MNKKKIITAITLAAALIVVSTIGFSNIGLAQGDIKVKVNDTEVYFPDQKPIIKAERTVVPLRFVSTALGGEVSWDSNTKIAKVTRGVTNIEMEIGSVYPVINGAKNINALDVPAEIINDRTMVPLRFVSEAFGATVNWDQATRTVLITDSRAPKLKPLVAQQLEGLYGVKMEYDNSDHYWSYQETTPDDKSYMSVFGSEKGSIIVAVQFNYQPDITGVKYDLSPIEKALNFFFPGNPTNSKIMDQARYAADLCIKSGRFERAEPKEFKVSGYSVYIASHGNDIATLSIVK